MDRGVRGLRELGRNQAFLLGPASHRRRPLLVELPERFRWPAIPLFPGLGLGPDGVVGFPNAPAFRAPTHVFRGAGRRPTMGAMRR